MGWKFCCCHSGAYDILSRKILLTGGSGFVGRQILKSLQDQDVDISLIVRSKSKKKITNRNKIREFIITKDLFSETINWWTDKCHGIDIVIHSAWYVEPGKYLQSDKNIDCLQGTLNLAKGAINSGVKKFVGIGTCFEYDSDQGYLSTSTRLKPITPYAAAKAAAYLSLSQWFNEEKVEFAWCRLFYLFGEGEDHRRLAPYIESQLMENKNVKLTNGNQIRDFMDVADAGKFITSVSLNNYEGAINICSGVPITVRQFSENIAKRFKKMNLLEFGARPENIVDPPCIVGILDPKIKDKS